MRRRTAVSKLMSPHDTSSYVDKFADEAFGQRDANFECNRGRGKKKRRSEVPSSF
jgi:hypothetical protein